MVMRGATVNKEVSALRSPSRDLDEQMKEDIEERKRGGHGR